MAWYDEAVFYHIYPLGLAGAEEQNPCREPNHRLLTLLPWVDHLKDIGCTALYIGPLFESVGHGYETTDYRKLDGRLGTNEDLTEFVKICHEKGIRVILDGVFNHTGREFFAFRDIREHREQSPYVSWYCNVNFQGNNEYGDGFSYDNWGGYNLLAKLNLRNEQVRDYLLETIRFWVREFDIDGLRLDAADVLDFDFMHSLRALAQTVKEDFWLMGEVIHGEYNRWVNENTLHSVTNYHLHKALFSGHNDHNYFEIAHTINRQMGMGIGNGVSLYNFADNHDVERIMTKLKNREHFLPVHILLYTLPGIPSVYYGSEFGIEGKKERYSDASLRPCLNLTELEKEANPCIDIIRKLGQVHAAEPDLRHGAYRELHLRTGQYAFARGEVLVTVNNEDKPAVFDLKAEGEYYGIFCRKSVKAQNESLLLEIGPNGGEIWIPQSHRQNITEQEQKETIEREKKIKSEKSGKGEKQMATQKKKTETVSQAAPETPAKEAAEKKTKKTLKQSAKPEAAAEKKPKKTLKESAKPETKAPETAEQAPEEPAAAAEIPETIPEETVNPEPEASEQAAPEPEAPEAPWVPQPRRSVAFIGSECYPFVKTGGLGDVMYALPRALVEQNCDVKVILPRYKCIPWEYQEKMVYRGSFHMDLCSDGRSFYVGIMEYVWDGVVYDFIDNEEFFSSGNPYINLIDDIPRFCYFSKAAIAALNYMDWIPDIIHCHDWQAALVPVYLRTLFEGTKAASAKTILTIHNLRFQGVYNIPTIRYWSNLPDYVFNKDALKQNYEDANMLKGGITYANMVTTVSNTYAGEIQSPFYGENLDAHLRYHSGKLRGIVNGIDYGVWDTATDNRLYVNYDITNALERKRENKRALQEELGLSQDDGKFVIGLISRLTDQKGLDLVDAIMPALIDGNTQVVVLGTGDYRYENSFRYYENIFRGTVCSNIMYDETRAHHIYAGADALLVPSLFEPCGLTQLTAMHYGTIPIVRETGGLKDTVQPYNQFANDGNGFTFDRYDAGLLLDAINRAKTLFFTNRWCWDEMLLRDMDKDVSWRVAAEQYRALYLELKP